MGGCKHSYTPYLPGCVPVVSPAGDCQQLIRGTSTRGHMEGESQQGYIIFKKAAWGGGIIFVPSAKNGEDYLYLEILLQILIKSKILLNIFGQILNF